MQINRVVGILGGDRLAIALANQVLSRGLHVVMFVEELDYPVVVRAFEHYTSIAPAVHRYSGTPNSLRSELEKWVMRTRNIPNPFISTLQMSGGFEPISPSESDERTLRQAFEWGLNTFLCLREVISFLTEINSQQTAGSNLLSILSLISISADIPMEYQLRLSLAESVLKSLLLNLRLELKLRGHRVRLTIVYPGLADVSLKEPPPAQELNRIAEKLLDIALNPPEPKLKGLAVGKVEVID